MPSLREYILSLCAERGLLGADAETAVDAYLATPEGHPQGADGIRVAAILGSHFENAPTRWIGG